MSTVTANNFEITENALDFLREEGVKQEVIDRLKPIVDRTYNDFEAFDTDLKNFLGTDYEDSAEKILSASEIVEDDEDTQSEDAPEDGSIYPYDPTKASIQIREEPQTVYELVVRKWDRQMLVIDPEFQRNFVWGQDQQSMFIESILLNFPLPPMYINITPEGKYVVVDGRQRITTLRGFLDNGFKLRGLKAIPSLNGKTFQDLVDIDEQYRTKIEDKKLLVYIIPSEVPLEMVYDIFNRINTGGTQLQRQEIRNCIFMGPATSFIGKLAKKPYFRQAIDNGISPKRMKDQEAVLRFLAFQIQDYQVDYKGSMNDFVEQAMRIMNKTNFTDEQFDELEASFEKAMKRSYSFFGNHNFRLPTNKTRGRINLALFESVADFFANTDESYLKSKKKDIVHSYNHGLLRDDKFINAIRYGTGSTTKVIERFDKVKEYLSK